MRRVPLNEIRYRAALIAETPNAGTPRRLETPATASSGPERRFELRQVALHLERPGDDGTTARS